MLPFISSRIRLFISTAYSSGQLLGDVVRKAADDQRAGVLLAHAAAHQVKDRLVADAADLGLVADVGVARADVHGGDRIGAGLGVEHQRLAGHGGLRAARALLDDNAAAEGADAAAPC